ncbi:unnamed protein product [Mesocestoides corti]|uniref:Exonuclease domain-containing protein n=1 Tax=Mesocestoides corti TaxID=53468 RepID=A0A0R3UFQ3_MESCO|nr:unnamed protein product [Mesocestoides corti]
MNTGSPSDSGPSVPPQSPIQSQSHGLTGFLRNSFSDISLDGFEEQLARVSANDTYVGPLRPNRRRKPRTQGTANDPSSPSSCDQEDEDPLRQVPYSTSSLAFVPPGVIIVSEIWRLFATERLSLCNGFISTMRIDALQRCLHAHNLNQLGSLLVLRKRLHEFVRRLRDSGRNTLNCGLPCEGEESRLAPLLEGTPLKIIEPDGCQMVKLAQPVVLTPDVFYNYLLIIDLEATCEMRQERDQAEFPHEIIEFPVLLYDTRQRKCVGVFHSYCRPTRNPLLSSFCKSLTQISQSQVDNAITFPKLLSQLETWLLVQNNLRDQRCAIVCDCSADMGKFMRTQCQLSGLQVPEWASVWINLSHAFHTFYRYPQTQKCTLATMLNDLDLSFVGQHHSGLDDAMNILRVVQIMLADGCQLRVNQRLDLGRPPSYSATVPRTVANSADGGIMGSRLGLLKKRTKSSVFPHMHSSDSPSDVNYSQSQSPVAHPNEINAEDVESLMRLHSIQKHRLNRSNP